MRPYLQEARLARTDRQVTQDQGRHTEGLQYRPEAHPPTQEVTAVQAARAEVQSAAARLFPEVLPHMTEVLPTQTAITAALLLHHRDRQATAQAVVEATAEEASEAAVAEEAVAAHPEEEDRNNH